MSDLTAAAAIDPCLNPLAGRLPAPAPAAAAAAAATADPANAVDSDKQPAPKKKQKRNKPTLSCEGCVERKTKCDRARPTCLACIKRQSQCRYSEIANLIASADHGAARSKSRKDTQASTSAPSSTTISPHSPPARHQIRNNSTSSSVSSPFLLSNIPHSKQSPSVIFGTGREHPFANYWTCQGGLPEVIGVLPSKDQADILVAKYLESVDPVYPMIDRQQFKLDYERFWSLDQNERHTVDAALLGLHFVVYAMAMQFVEMPSDRERMQIAEFYASASSQALRISSYLSRTSIRTIQAMVLIGYFLMNDNKASDAWAHGGILIRQAYAMGLNRDPEVIVPHASAMEKQQRLKVWQAVLFQDTFLTVLLKLPPTSTFTDVSVDSLLDDPETDIDGIVNGSQNVINNPMSISNIVPTLEPVPPPGPSCITNDIAFIRSMWHLANIVQRNVCVPRALSHPLTHSPQEKVALLTSFRTLYASFPTSLTDTSHAATARLAVDNPRVARQSLFLRSNFWHCMLLIYADEYEPGGVVCDVRGALGAGRMGIAAFFDFWNAFRVDVGVWWVFQHRAFEEALAMARLLATPPPQLQSPSETLKPPVLDPLYVAARTDVQKMLEILEHVGSGAPEMQKTRTDVLRTAVEGILW